jgi:hypothetical protein
MVSLGAATEFTLRPELTECRWRILPGPPARLVYAAQPYAIELERPYRLKADVVTLAGGRYRYRTKIWLAGADEPESWHAENMEAPADDFPSGGALVVAHHADVTVGRIAAGPVTR